MFDIAALYEGRLRRGGDRARRAHPEARLIAGGSDLLVKIRDGKLTGAELIFIRGIAELAGVCEMPDGTLKIGPLTSFSQLGRRTRSSGSACPSWARRRTRSAARRYATSAP